MKLVQIPSFISIGTTDIELRELKEKKNNMDKMKQIMFSSNIKRKWYFSEIFHTQFCFVYAVKSSKVELT